MKYKQPYHLNMFPSSKIALHNGHTFVTASAYTNIIDYITGTHLAEYVQEQNKWPDQVFHTINWEAIGRYMKGMPISKQARYVSICTIGKTQDDKNKNLHNRLDSTRRTKKIKKQYICPFGCGRVEQDQHYLRCQRSPKYNHKLMCLKR